jgi:hypothetical protein
VVINVFRLVKVRITVQEIGQKGSRTKIALHLLDPFVEGLSTNRREQAGTKRKEIEEVYER